MVFTMDTMAMMRFFIVSIVHPVVSIVVKENGGFVMADCIKCNKKLWNDNEKNTGYCDNCRKFGDGHCTKCLKKLWNANEKNTGYCDHCRKFGDSKCKKCGRHLWNPNEKNTGYCDHCRTFG